MCPDDAAKSPVFAYYEETRQECVLPKKSWDYQRAQEGEERREGSEQRRNDYANSKDAVCSVCGLTAYTYSFLQAQYV